jgi:lipoprotein-anchoring transpeptidase ErfK/SrfK
MFLNKRALTGRAAAAVLALAVGGGAAPPAAAQMALSATDVEKDARVTAVEATALERGRYAVLIDLDENRLDFRKGDVVLWSAPIGTGMGMRMQAEDKEWDFSTPTGVFHVKYKEEDPTWIAPDWYFVENGLPVPPVDDPRRKMPGRLGAAAVYINQDLAIHGTDRPELLGQRVSHGCIRLENRYAKRLYHNVQVGTEVIIVGGEGEEQQTISAREMQRHLAANFRPAPRPLRDPLLEGWREFSTIDLLRELRLQLRAHPDRSRWSDVASLLGERAFKDDDELALRGLLLAIEDVPSPAVEREYATFLVDAYSRGAVPTLEALSTLMPRQRQRVADAIVRASLGLYSGDWEAHSAPWPTRRVPASVVEPEARRGWAALQEAEKAYRDAGERLAV